MLLNRQPDKTANSSFAAAVGRQARVVTALLIRDMMTRYGRANIGFLWVILEPLILTAGVLIIWSSLKPPYEHGVQVISLVMTGYMPLTLWRHLTQSGVFAFRRSMGLLYHRHVTLIDTLFAKLALEFLGTTGALFIVYGALLATGYIQPFVDPGLALLGWFMMGFLGMSVGACIAVLTECTESAERFIQPMQYFILPLSGCFYMADWLPANLYQYAMYVPLLHCYEMFRAGLFGESVVTHYTVLYPALFATVLLTVALSQLHVVRDRLNTS